MKTIYSYNYMLFGFVIFFFVSYVPAAFAQTSIKKMYAVEDIVVEDTAMLYDGSIHFTMSKNGINSNLASDMDTFDCKIIAAKTRLIIPLTGAVNYGRLTYLNQQQASKLPLNHNNDLFIFQPGDSVV